LLYYEKSWLINCFAIIDLSIELTKDLNLFDIKKMKGDYKKGYYRLRKG